MFLNRAGLFVRQQSDYSAYIPNPLPPTPPLDIDRELLNLLSDADRKLGRLDGLTQVLPNPDLFVAMYVQKEAVLSSQIEGTQASFVDVLQMDFDPEHKRNDVEEVVNYVKAMKFGMQRLEALPLCLRLICEIHGILMSGVRGSTRNPGEFRRSQNWIGPTGCTLATASFVPPPPAEMSLALGDLEKYMHQENDLPKLIQIALIHAQFETIHPFLDGNGRMGRLLITFWLYQQKILDYPLLYISYFFKKNRMEYYDRLSEIRNKGDWENWVKFFLRAVVETSDEATTTGKLIIQLKDRFSKILQQETRGKGNSLLMLDFLFEQPVVTVNSIRDHFNVSYPTAKILVDNFVRLKILKLIDEGRARNKVYIFSEYVDILSKGTELS